MNKQCPVCGENIKPYQVRCARHRKHRPITIIEKHCRRCGQAFTPATNYHKLCQDCATGDYRKDQYREMFTPENPCSRCFYLKRCRVLVKQADTWPLCWAMSPERDKFIRRYAGEKSQLGMLARALLDAVQLEEVSYDQVDISSPVCV